MTLHIVVSGMRDTSSRYSKSTIRVRRTGQHILKVAIWAVWVLGAALLLTACSTDEEEVPAPTPVAEVTDTQTIVGTAQEASTALPTAVPPTATLVPTPTPPAPLAATVNGQYIFLADYEQRVARFEEALQEQGLDAGTGEGQAYLGQARQEVLESMIDMVLIEQSGAALGVGLSDAEVEAQIEADIVAGGGAESFEEWLQATGQTRDDYKELLRQSMLTQRVLEAVTADVTDVAEQVHARHIVLETEEAAREVVALLQSGADFAELAREYSIDPLTRDSGGDLDWFPRELIAPELESAAFALQPGEYSEVIVMGDSYHILQVVEKEDARPLSAEFQLLVQQSRFERWLEEQKTAAIIERFVGE